MHTADKMMMAYYLTAERYLIKRLALEEIDKGFEECEAGFLPYRRQHENGLKYISLINKPMLNHLTEEDLATFSQIIDAIEQSSPDTDERAAAETEAEAFIRNTYRQVLSQSLIPNSKAVFFNDIHGRGIFPSDSILLRFSYESPVDEQGEINWDDEAKRGEIFSSVKAQFEELAKTHYPTENIFLVMV